MGVNNFMDHGRNSASNLTLQIKNERSCKYIAVFFTCKSNTTCHGLRHSRRKFHLILKYIFWINLDLFSALHNEIRTALILYPVRYSFL